MTGKLTLAEFDRRYGAVAPLRRFVEDGDIRLRRLQYDDSAAAFQLWDFLMSEEERLHRARGRGKKIVGVMKDLGTVAVMAYAFPELVAFYPDGAWWLPCYREMHDGLLDRAAAAGIDDSFCPVRAMLGAFLAGDRFPRPDLLLCSAGAVCDDFSTIVQRLAECGFPVAWWEMPCRRTPDAGEPCVRLANGWPVPAGQVDMVEAELARVLGRLENLAGHKLAGRDWPEAIRAANRVRRLVAGLRAEVFAAPVCPLPALEMMIVEMLAIHYCSDRDETVRILEELTALVRARIAAGTGVLPADAVRVFWVNPVADLRMMNLIEECGGRICGTDYMVGHAFTALDETLPPLAALARAALADPMVGPAGQRADLIAAEIEEYRCAAAVISRIPGASHCATEGKIIADRLRARCGIPVLELEVPPLTDALRPGLVTRISAMLELAGPRKAR